MSPSQAAAERIPSVSPKEMSESQEGFSSRTQPVCGFDVYVPSHHPRFLRLENSQLQTAQTLATSAQRITRSPLRTPKPLKGGFVFIAPRG